MTIAQQLGLQTGDIVKMPFLATGWIKHFAVFAVDAYGNEFFAENVRFGGVQIIIADEFFAGLQSNFFIDKFLGNDFQRNMVINRINRLVGTPYHFLNYNCEHFVSQVRTGKAESQQIINGVALLFTGCLIRLAVNRD
jgi:hypothetical protein